MMNKIVVIIVLYLFDTMRNDVLINWQIHVDASLWMFLSFVDESN